jgi:Reverse transcriptase (RNA-dependent DNA polymerase)
VWFHHNDDGRLDLVIAVYVDDIVYGRPSSTRKWFKEKIKQHFKIKDLGRQSKHLGTWYKKLKDKKGESNPATNFQ